MESYRHADKVIFELKAKSEEPLFKAYMKQIYDRVFTSRNINWIEQFEQLSTENPETYFVLVGAGHYFGPNNIRELLELKEYSIEKI